MARTAVIAGVGPGLGASLAERFDEEGCAVGLFSRSDHAAELAGELDEAVGLSVDVGDAEDVARGFERVREALGPVDVLVNHASGGGWNGLAGTDAAEFERAWRTAAHGGFLCTKAALPDLRDGGTVIFTGATSAVRGNGDAVAFAASKFAVRGLAGSLARDLGPEGVHVAHVVVDGGILPPDGPRAGADEGEYLDPDAIAESYWHLVEQDRSAWTLELDLRPHVEEF